MRLPRPIFLFARKLLHGLTRLLIGLVRILPERSALALGRGLGGLTWTLFPRWCATAQRNMRIFFAGEPLGEDTPRATRERSRIGASAARHLGCHMIEFIRMGSLPIEAALEMIVETDGIERMQAAIAEGRGVIALGMHYGNWEIAGAYLTQRIRRLHAVGKEQTDTFFTDIAFPWRERYGTKNIFAGDKASSAILRALRAGDILGLIADQNGGKRGVYAPFAGTTASTVTGPAILALRTGAPLVLVYALRLAPGRLRFICGPRIDTAAIPGHDPESGQYTDESIVELLTRINAAYEHVIRADPTQWLWGHKRWRTRPPGEPSLY